MGEARARRPRGQLELLHAQAPRAQAHQDVAAAGVGQHRLDLLDVAPRPQRPGRDPVRRERDRPQDVVAEPRGLAAGDARGPLDRARQQRGGRARVLVAGVPRPARQVRRVEHVAVGLVEAGRRGMGHVRHACTAARTGGSRVIDFGAREREGWARGRIWNGSPVEQTTTGDVARSPDSRSIGGESCAPPAYPEPCSALPLFAVLATPAAARADSVTDWNQVAAAALQIARHGDAPGRRPGGRLDRAPGDGPRRRLRRGQRDCRLPPTVRVLAPRQALVLPGCRRRGRGASCARQRRARGPRRASAGDRGRVPGDAPADPGRACEGRRDRRRRGRCDGATAARGAGRGRSLRAVPFH